MTVMASTGLRALASASSRRRRLSSRRRGRSASRRGVRAGRCAGIRPTSRLPRWRDQHSGIGGIKLIDATVNHVGGRIRPNASQAAA